MLEKIYRLLELIAIVICLHNFYGKKFKIDIYCIGYIVFELVLMQLIQDNYISNYMYFIVYIIYFIYGYIKFGKSVKHTILNCLLAILTIGIFQMIVYMPLCFLYNVIKIESVIILLINLTVCILIVVTGRNNKYKKIADFCVGKEWILRISTFIAIMVMLYCMYTIKSSWRIQIDVYVLLIIFAILAVVVVYRWQKANFEISKKEKELEITNFYNDACRDLIEIIRRKQHDINNHIDAIYGMHLTATTIEELVDAQKEYCDKLLLNNKYSKVLNNIDNSVLAGYIYTKFTDIEQKDIKIEYDLFYSSTNSYVTIYELVEMVGILLDNAAEAVYEEQVNKLIKFKMYNADNQLEICVQNPVLDITNNDVSQFFVKNFSTKGENRGMGLCKLKEFQKKYKIDIMVHIFEENDSKWIEFKIITV